MFIGWNAEGVHGKRKVGNPWFRIRTILAEFDNLKVENFTAPFDSVCYNFLLAQVTL